MPPAKHKTQVILNKNYEFITGITSKEKTILWKKETNCQNDQEFLRLWNEEINMKVHCSAGMSTGQQYTYF